MVMQVCDFSCNFCSHALVIYSNWLHSYIFMYVCIFVISNLPEHALVPLPLLLVFILFLLVRSLHGVLFSTVYFGDPDTWCSL